MSLGGLQAQGLARAYAAGRAKIVQQNEDRRRGEFLRALDVSDERLAEFEEKFVADFMQKHGDQDRTLDWRFFTDGRRRVVDNLMKRYRPPGLKTAVVRAMDAPAEPGCCGYFVERDGLRNQRCGDPAAITLQNGLELCQAHHKQQQERIEKLRQWKTRNMR
jgi:hypothetical protein